MRVNTDDVAFCIGKAHEIAEHYQRYVLPGDAVLRSMDELQPLVGQYVGKGVEIRALDRSADGSSIMGMCAVFDDHFEIYILAELTDDLRRFVLCKELFHVVLDSERSRNGDIYEHLVEVATTFPVVDSQPNCAAAWEVLAEAAAMEFMFPYKERAACLASGNFDPAVVAKRYGIPQIFVEAYCNPRAMDFWADYQGDAA
jgi:Zn-dependent peptidase ImmA (M78 family)